VEIHEKRQVKRTAPFVDDEGEWFPAAHVEANYKWPGAKSKRKRQRTLSKLLGAWRDRKCKLLGRIIRHKQIDRPSPKTPDGELWVYHKDDIQAIFAMRKESESQAFRPFNDSEGTWFPALAVENKCQIPSKTLYDRLHNGRKIGGIQFRAKQIPAWIFSGGRWKDTWVFHGDDMAKISGVPIVVATASTNGQEPSVETAPKQPPLSDLQYDILDTLAGHGAFSGNMRMTSMEIATELKIESDITVVLRALSQLKKLGFIDSKEGRGGGVWRTGKTI
jgi:hypothetical protein